MPTIELLFEYVEKGISSTPTLEELEASLGMLLKEPVAINREPSGGWYLTYTRALVDRVGSFRIAVRPKEAPHNLPHFHVEGPGIDASFELLSCTRLAGRLPSGAENKIQVWFERNRFKVIEAWNRFHPERQVQA